MNKLKKPLLFALALLPIAVVGGIFTALYQIDLYSDAILSEAVAELGSVELLVVIVAIQTVGYALFCGFFGAILSDKVGLLRPLGFEKKKLLTAVLISLVLGILFSLDYWTFGSVIDGIRPATAAGVTVSGVIASVLYGGVIEEVMLRLFFLSLIAFLLWKLFCKKADKAHIPSWVFVTANLVAALFFAAGHLPATLITFGELSLPILFRCFLLNGGFAIAFGWLYRKYGIQYAMLAHAGTHIVSKLIWFIFI